MNVPEDLKYTETHEWASLEKDGTVTIGITDHAQHELTDIVYIDDFPEIGDKIEAGMVVAVIESVKAVADVVAPVSGTLTEINAALEDNPELLNEDAYDAWILRVTPSDASELDKLLDAKEYTALL